MFLEGRPERKCKGRTHQEAGWVGMKLDLEEWYSAFCYPLGK